MIIDSHVHYGNGSLGNFSPEFLLNIIDNSADIVICSNLSGIEPEVGVNEWDCNIDMINVAKKYPKIKPLAVCEVDRTENADIIEKLLIEYNEFIGLKIHPEFSKLPATSEKYNPYLELARKYKKPCLYHSGHIKSRFSSPELIYKKAQEFSDVPIILGHLSTGPKHCHIRAIEILLESIEKENATLYVDISWVDYQNENLEDSLMLIDALKNTKKGDFTHRIMWASDAPVGEFNQDKVLYKNNLEKFKTKVLEKFGDEKLLEDLLCNNARKLYGI